MHCAQQNERPPAPECQFELPEDKQKPPDGNVANRGLSKSEAGGIDFENTLERRQRPSRAASIAFRDSTGVFHALSTDASAHVIISYRKCGLLVACRLCRRVTCLHEIVNAIEVLPTRLTIQSALILFRVRMMNPPRVSIAKRSPWLQKRSLWILPPDGSAGAHDVLDRLETIDPTATKLVTLRFFTELNMTKVIEVQGPSGLLTTFGRTRVAGCVGNCATTDLSCFFA